MAANQELAAMFDRMAKVLELKGANRFRVNAYERAARTLENMTDDVADYAADVKTLTALEGIGEGMAEKILEWFEAGDMAEYREVTGDVPAGLLDVLEIPGLGPKTVKRLWEEAGVESIGDLKEKLEGGELERMPRMGGKTLDNMREAIRFTESAGRRRRAGRALPLALRIIDALKEIDGLKRIDYAGSLRRGKETVGDVDVLVACDDPAAVADAFVNLDGVEQVIASGKTKSSIRLDKGLQVDLRIVPEDRYGAALAYFTGSKEHNVRLRERAVRMGYSLNEYGLWNKGEEDTKDAEPIVSKTEAEIYGKLGLAYVAPELREDAGEIDAAEKGELPELIELDDVRCDLHCHTTASDGHLSIEALADLAKGYGYHTVAVTDHSKSQVQASGLDDDRLRRHIDAVRKADEKTQGIRILAGTEVDILADGSLDYPDDLLEQLDIVVASPHTGLNQDPAKATDRLLKAIEHPSVHIIGHATGRIINKREGLSPDMGKLFEAAAKHGAAFEINANPLRLDLRDSHARAAIQAGALLSINTDTHGRSDMALLPYGVRTARRAWARKEHVLNCRTAEQLTKWLGIA